MSTSEVDYIIVGGGLTGCAIASRLHQRNPALEVAVIEAGPDPSGNPNATTFMGGLALAGSDLNYSFQTVPIANTNSRVHTLSAGKTLGGGSILNYGGWARGDASDYDQWAKAVEDDRWSYKGLLPYMRKSENFYDKTDPEQHGFEGPMKVTSVSQSDQKRRYPLREPVKDAWTELGVEFEAKPCSGRLAGIEEHLENWDNGIRQPTQLGYSLEGVRVLTSTEVQRVLFSDDGKDGKPKASAVEFTDGRTISARREIIISAGALRTPQVLMLSGIGPKDTLAKHGIPLVHESREVGKNLFDHFALYQVWKLRHPEKGLALGSPLLSDLAFFKGLPLDWNVCEGVPAPLLAAAVEKDGSSENDPLLQPGRAHVETLVVYSPMAPGVPVDGSYIATSVMLLLPTSRGTVTIASASPVDPPVIDANYFDTHADRTALVYGTRRAAQALLGTAAGREFIESEIPPPGMKPITIESTDEEIEGRIRAVGIAHFHAAGSVAMGKVVDPELRVYGVSGLRVADASVFPVAVGGHPQATLYALAEQAAEMVLCGLK